MATETVFDRKLIEQVMYLKPVKREGTKFVREVPIDPLEEAIAKATEIMKQGG